MALYPPTIEGQLPLAVLNGNNIKFTIPYEINRGTDPASIKGYSVKIKNLISDKLLATVQVKDFQENEIEVDITKNNNFNLGDYYKIQVAFGEGVDKDSQLTNIGYYSTNGICKLISLPELKLTQENEIWTGTYKNTFTDELLYSSEFILKNQDSGEIVERSGVLLSNYLQSDNIIIEENEEKKILKTEFYTFKTPADLVNSYVVEWHIETSSGYKTFTSQEIDTIFPNIVKGDHTLKLIAQQNTNSGSIDLGIREIDRKGELITNGIPPGDGSYHYNFGSYKIAKSSSKDNFSTWEEICDLENLYTWDVSYGAEVESILKDYNVEQGVSYQYKLWQYNDYNVQAAESFSGVISPAIEDIFLSDETRQLRIAFNPKVSSMKNNILESKQDTIGGKYPYIFRNGNVKYKEFSISGLISYLEDPENDFNIDFGEFQFVNTTNLTNENVAKERIFKTEVLEWLNDGKPKLLRTGTEGNYVVRIMNVSMSPNDTLGRMLHTFTATAVEIDPNQLEIKPIMKTKERLASVLRQKEEFDGTNRFVGWYYDVYEIFFHPMQLPYEADYPNAYYTVKMYFLEDIVEIDNLNDKATIYEVKVPMTGLRYKVKPPKGKWLYKFSIPDLYSGKPTEFTDETITKIENEGIYWDLYFTINPHRSMNRFYRMKFVDCQEQIGTIVSIENKTDGNYYWNSGNERKLDGRYKVDIKNKKLYYRSGQSWILWNSETGDGSALKDQFGTTNIVWLPGEKYQMNITLTLPNIPNELHDTWDYKVGIYRDRGFNQIAEVRIPKSTNLNDPEQWSKIGNTFKDESRGITITTQNGEINKTTTFTYQRTIEVGPISRYHHVPADHYIAFLTLGGIQQVGHATDKDCMFNYNRKLDLSLTFTPVIQPCYQFYKTLSIVKSPNCPDKGEVYVRYKTIEGEVKTLTILDQLTLKDLCVTYLELKNADATYYRVEAIPEFNFQPEEGVNYQKEEVADE